MALLIASAPFLVIAMVVGTIPLWLPSPLPMFGFAGFRRLLRPLRPTRKRNSQPASDRLVRSLSLAADSAAVRRPRQRKRASPFRTSSSVVWPYLPDVLRRLPAIDPKDTAALEALPPNRWVAAYPEYRLEQREEESREAQARRRRKRVIR